MGENEKNVHQKLVLFNFIWTLFIYGQDYERQKWSGTSYQSLLGFKTSLEKFILLI